MKPASQIARQLASAMIIALALQSPAGAITLPAGFVATQLFAGASISGPTALAFLPDGTMLIAEQAGTLRVAVGGNLSPTPAISLGSRVCDNIERGLLGVAVDPKFITNRFIYLYYTFRKFPQADNPCPTGQPLNPENPVNRVSRFVLSQTNVVDAASETVLIDNIPSPGGNHNGGDLHFGKDGNLYVSVGDGGTDYAGDSGGGGNNDAARDKHMLLGKILRINRNGGIPATNPFQGAQTGRCNVSGGTTVGFHCRETYAWGLRNPFRFAMDRNDPGVRFFINDVGQDREEEIDDAAAGADFGWNCREGLVANSNSGPCSPTPVGMVDPVFRYLHGTTLPGATTGCYAITGGAFVPNGWWPSMDGAYLVADYGCGVIAKLTNPMGTLQASQFATALGVNSATSLQFGPFRSEPGLYFTSYSGNGQVWLIRYVDQANSAPTVMGNAQSTTGAAPLTVMFSGVGSVDPDAGDSLTYFWDFGDGTTLASQNPTVSHVYAGVGAYMATLRVRDTHFAFSAPVSFEIHAISAPPSIDVDADGVYDPFTDGLLVLRRMFGLAGPALTAAALSSEAQRTDATDVATYLDEFAGSLDVDGNLGVDALTDGLLIVRYMFGLRGSALVQGAVGPGAQRTPEQIEAHLATLLP
jgi:glucose/arabinose dehydrogenase